ncbi:MAG: hypothetical protein IJI33_08670 [Solobacterium sp.]|nr:hypothetical protein [Solobacterium sp.]
MSNLTEFKCPNCGGPLEFDSTVQKLRCPYCRSTYTIEELDAQDIENNADEPISLEWDAGTSVWKEEEIDAMAEYVCRSCGGTIVTDRTTSATSCPFCGNPVVMNDQVSGMLRPDLVIPFKLDKEAAKAGLRRHLSDKKLLPRVFTEENHIDEIKGVYVPFWLFDADVRADMRYRATRVRSWTEGDYNVTETSYYSVYRGGTLSFSAVPVDGSRKMDDILMEAIEPFDVSAAVPFSTAYLAGYYADKYDVSDEETFGRANERIKVSTMSTFDSTVVGYSGVTPQGVSIGLNRGTAQYALYPVWLLNTSWQGQQYTFAMNGQTGKFVGDLPVDNGRYWIMALRNTGIVALILLIIMMLVLR